MTQPQSAFRRAPRPLTGWLWVLVGFASFAFLVLLAIPLLRAVNRWADGEHVDWVGFAAVASIAAGAMGQLITQGMQWMQNRSAERREEIRAGGSAAPPFPSPAPSAPYSPPQQNPDPSFPEGGLVNNQAIE